MSTDATTAPMSRTIPRLVGRMIGGPRRNRAAVAALCLAVAMVGLIVIPYATGRGMNVISEDGSKGDLTQWAVVGAIAGAVYLLFSYVANRLFSKLAAEALCDLQTDLFDNVQTLSMGFFFKNSPGELSSNVTNDAEVISLFYTTAVSQILRSSMQVLLIVVIMFALNWQLALVAILTIPVLAGVAYAIAQISGPAFNRLQETLGDVSAFQEETLSGHKVIISNNRSDWASERHEEHVDGVYKVGRRAFMAALMQFPITQTLSLVQNVLVLVTGTFLVINGSTTLGTVLAFAGYSALLASPLAEMANLITATLNVAAGGDRVFRIIDERPDVTDAPDAVDYEFKGGRIEFDHVDFGYVPNSLVLRGNTFEVEPGESIGICGPTGAGKSTLINILTRYYDITAGRILIDDQDLSTLTQASLRKQIGVVLQEAFLFTDTVMNNLLYANEDATGKRRRRGGEEGQRTRLHHGAARRVRHDADRAGREPEPGATPDDHHRPGDGRGSEDDDPRRGDLERRHPHREAHPGRHAQADGRQDQLLDRSPPRHDSRLQPDHGAQRRRHRGTGQPRRTHGREGLLLRPLYEPVQGKGTWWRFRRHGPGVRQHLTRSSAAGRRDRFDRELLIEYLAARGVCPDDPSTFGEACLISGEPTTGRSISVTQLRKDLGLD